MRHKHKQKTYANVRHAAISPRAVHPTRFTPLVFIPLSQRILRLRCCDCVGELKTADQVHHKRLGAFDAPKRPGYADAIVTNLNSRTALLLKSLHGLASLPNQHSRGAIRDRDLALPRAIRARLFKNRFKFRFRRIECVGGRAGE